MKEKFVLLAILLFVSPLGTQGITKISLNSEWVYRDSRGTNYNETNTENFVRGDNGYATIQTERPFPFEYYRFSVDMPIAGTKYARMVYNLTQGVGSIYATQSGGLPVYHNRGLLGTVNFTTILDNNDRYSYFKELVKDDPEIKPIIWTIAGEIESGLVTGTPRQINIDQRLIWGVNKQVQFTYEQLMSSFESNNFTVQYEELSLNLQIENAKQTDQLAVVYKPLTSTFRLLLKVNNTIIMNTQTYSDFDPLSLNQVVVAYKISLNDESEVPVYISQAEPVRIGNSLNSLLKFNQLDSVVEYFLVEDIDTSRSGFNIEPESGPLDFPWQGGLVFLILIPIYLRRRGLPSLKRAL